MIKLNHKVDEFISKNPQWQEQLEMLRTIILACGLIEELKWNVPVYTFQNKNIVGINGLKESCVIAFFKGALLKDVNGILTKPGQHTQAGRWIKFSNVKEIIKLKAALKAYIKEAIEVEKAGLKVKLKKTLDFTMPEEFQNKLNKIPALKKAFYALTPGRQRAYILYFSQAKLSKTREARVEKWMQQILNGQGLND